MTKKGSFDFKLNGISYSDIGGYSMQEGLRLSIGVSGTAKMLRQWMKQKYPTLPVRNYYWVKSQDFSGGDSIMIYLNDAPKEIFEAIKKELSFFQKGIFDPTTDTYIYGTIDEKTEDGRSIGFGTKYLDISNKPPFGTDAPQVNWDLKEKKKPSWFPTSKSNPQPKRSYPMGDVLKKCAGWTIYKKTLPDGRIVYNAKIDEGTQPNKTDWETIKTEVYLKAGFKWGKFGAFERWGQVPYEDENLKSLCGILLKYYKGNDPEEKKKDSEELPIKVGEYITDNEEDGLIVYEVREIKNNTIYTKSLPTDRSNPQRPTYDINITDFKTRYASGDLTKVVYDLKNGEIIIDSNGVEHKIIGFEDANSIRRIKFEVGKGKEIAHSQLFIYQKLFSGDWKLRKNVFKRGDLYYQPKDENKIIYLVYNVTEDKILGITSENKYPSQELGKSFAEELLEMGVLVKYELKLKKGSIVKIKNNLYYVEDIYDTPTNDGILFKEMYGSIEFKSPKLVCAQNLYDGTWELMEEGGEDINAEEGDIYYRSDIKMLASVIDIKSDNEIVMKFSDNTTDILTSNEFNNLIGNSSVYKKLLIKIGDILSAEKTKDNSDWKWNIKIVDVGEENGVKNIIYATYYTGSNPDHRIPFVVDSLIDLIDVGKIKIKRLYSFAPLSQEKIKDIISGLEVLAEMGDEKAKAMIDGLQVLLIS